MIFIKIKRIFISNVLWEILNRTFFNRISKYNGGYTVANGPMCFFSLMSFSIFCKGITHAIAH